MQDNPLFDMSIGLGDQDKYIFVAGLLERGSFIVNKFGTNKCTSAVIHLSLDEETCKWFVRNIGGVYKKLAGSDSFRVSVYGWEAGTLIKKCLPWVVSRRPLKIKFIEYCMTFPPKDGSGNHSRKALKTEIYEKRRVLEKELVELGLVRYPASGRRGNRFGSKKKDLFSTLIN